MSVFMTELFHFYFHTPVDFLWTLLIVFCELYFCTGVHRFTDLILIFSTANSQMIYRVMTALELELNGFEGSLGRDISGIDLVLLSLFSISYWVRSRSRLGIVPYEVWQ
jgi:hypothetical protein